MKKLTLADVAEDDGDWEADNTEDQYGDTLVEEVFIRGGWKHFVSNLTEAERRRIFYISDQLLFCSFKHTWLILLLT